jgi:hypothetical protein
MQTLPVILSNQEMQSIASLNLQVKEVCRNLTSLHVPCLIPVSKVA